MQLHRKQDLSIYYWLKNLLPTFIAVEDGFPLTDLEPPTVSIESMDIKGIPFELGGREKDKRFWQIDVFALNKAQRDDLAYEIYAELEGGIPVYDYDEGCPPDYSPTQIGLLNCYGRENNVIHVFRELVRELYWRRSIAFWTEYESMEA